MDGKLLVTGALCVLGVVAQVGCAPPPNEQVGVATVAITTVPADVLCVRVTAQGVRTVTRAFDVQPGASSTLTLTGLPTGDVQFSGQAFGSACAAVVAGTAPSWTSDPVTATVSSSTVVSVALVMRRNGRASVSIDFSDDTPPPPDASVPSPATALDGESWIMSCGPNQAFSDLTCQDFAPGTTTCPQTNPYLTRGTIIRDDTITFGGTPGTQYNVTVRFRGVVEPKHYINGMKDLAREGLYVGGQPNEAGNFNVYMLGVSSPAQSYFLNALNQPEAHFSYAIDYTVTIPIDAGAQIRFLGSDSNCSSVRNCDVTSIEGLGGQGQCHPITIPGLTAPIVQPFNGQFIVMNVVSSTPS